MVTADPSCLMGDAGISVFLLSLPFQQERLFFEREIRNGVFQWYKQSVESNFRGTTDVERQAEFAKYLYQPTAYYLFGRFDLAVLSLIDDFEFSVRTFHPFDPKMGRGAKSYSENFVYKVITGPTPCFRSSSDVIDLARQTFLCTPRKPLFALTLLKLNNSLLIGSGASFLRAVVSHIKGLSKRWVDRDLDVVILESYSWHEITVLMFAQSYRVIVEFVAAVRESTLGSIVNVPNVNAVDGSLLALHVQAHGGSLLDSHVFADSETTLGFDFDLLDGELPKDGLAQDDLIELFTRWSVKPGHLKEAGDILRSSVGREPLLTLGRGDLAIRYPPDLQQGAPRSTRSVLEEYLAVFRKLELGNHVLHPHTLVVSRVERTSFEAPLGQLHPTFTDRIRNLRFTIETLGRLQDQLRALGTPKIVSLKVANMFANFNDGVLDRNLYGYFAELLPFMDDVVAMIEESASRPGSVQMNDWCTKLQKIVDNFERAYRNRFHNSYRLGEVSDFNVDFKGGIQQLVTAFDGAYKAISSAVGNDHSFVCVSGDPGVHSTSYEARLNHFHIFQPETFLTVAVHEAAWCCFTGVPTGMSDTSKESLDEIKSGISELRSQANELWSDLNEQQLLSGADRKLQDELGTYFLRSLVLDRLAFCLAYNRDLHLFWYWYWAFFVQVPMSYESPLKVSPRNAAEFCLRLCTVSGVPERDTAEELLRPFLGRGTTIREMWEQRGAAVTLTVKRFYSDDRMRRWLGLVNRFVDTIQSEVYAEECPQTGSDRTQVRIESIGAEIARRAANVKERLEAGDVIPLVEKGQFAHFRFTSEIFLAYLRLLMDKFGVDGTAVLVRGADGSPQVGADAARILFDPRGGAFTHDPETRRLYFRYRSALTMSLWDLALKMKRDLIWNRLESFSAPAG